MDPSSSYGDSQVLHHQQQSQQQPQYHQQRQRQDREMDYWRQQNLQQYHQQQANAASVGAGMSITSPNSGSPRPSNKPPLPVRSSTVGSPNELERRNVKSASDWNSHPQHARSEDLNHGSGVVSANGMNSYSSSSSQGSPSLGYLSLSRPMTPVDNSNINGASSSNHSDVGGGGAVDDVRSRRLSTTSNPASSSLAMSSTTTLQNPIQSTACAACLQQLDGAFVRALGNVWHLQCFKCKDCDAVVASKFFPIETPEGKQQPLCERDYFRRLNLICAKCGQALRASYITACNKKYHVEHFTCSVCPTVFGPQDSYYEHENDVYCHFHYSTRFATKCAGCNSAILKQFVEINRNNRDECWHPECYMINKFWNVKISSRRLSSPSTLDVAEPAWKEDEERETAQSLKSKQVRMEQQVYRIWTVLSAFEESSAACISDMLRFVSNGQYLDAVRMAEKFILHVEVLFATIDDLEVQFLRLNLKSLAHVREARLLCRKTVDLFTLLSRPQDASQRRTGITQELLALVTGLAHYLKILIRIALTGGLKLERDHGHREAMEGFLDKLHLLVVEGGNPSARRMIRGGEKTTGGYVGAPGTQGVTYGFKSLAPENAGESPFGAENGSSELTERLSVSPPTDQCVRCLTTVEEDCARFGTYHRWHSHCLQCSSCGVAAGPPVVKEQPPPAAKTPGGEDKEAPAPKVSVPRRPPANVDNYVCDLSSAKDSPYGPVPQAIYCLDHQRPGCQGGFQAASRLEQYAFLLNIALRRLSYVLKKRGLLLPSQVPSSALQAQETPGRDPYRDSGELTRMKTAHLDRKVSATATARLPRRSTIVESPSGKTAQTTDFAYSQRAVLSSAAQEKALQHQQAIAGTPTRPSRPAGNMLAITQPQQASVPQQPQQQLAPNPQQQLPQQSFAQPVRPRVNTPGPLPATNVDEKGQMYRPPFARANTGVLVVDDSAPNSPAGGVEEPQLGPVDDGITLADIPQVLAAEEARKRHQSLPSESPIPHMAELTPLELMIVKHAALLSLYRSPLKSEFDLDDLLEFVEVKKSGFWNKLFNKGGKQKKGIFGVPLEILVEREGADSVLGASRASLRVPSFIDDVISAMRQMDMSVEGIFRKNGNIRRLNDLTEAIDRDPSSVDLTQDNAVQLAALLKKFLKALPEPLMTYKLYRLFMAAENHTNEVEKKRLLHLVTCLLPKGNRDTVEVLFVFLKWVASFAHVDEETGNRMDLHNLATVISPNIFRSYASKGSDNVRVESFEGIRVCDTLLVYQDEFFLVPEEFLPLLRDQEFFANCADLPSKEFLKRCDQYFRQKPNNGRPQPHPGLTSPVIGSQPFSASTSMSSMARDGSEGGRLATQKSDPAMSSRGRQLVEPGSGGRGNVNGYDARMYPSAPHSLERSATPQDNYLRNGAVPPRQQSPPPRLPHQPFSHPPMGQSPTSFQQSIAGMAGVGAGPGVGSGASPIPIPGSLSRSGSPMMGGSSTQESAEWAASAQPPQMPASMSSSYTPRNSGEHSHSQQSHGHVFSATTAPNGHAPMQVRQRT